MKGLSRQRGISFVELTFVVMLLGLIASLLAQLVPAIRRSAAQAESVQNLDQVDHALLAFAAIHARLPCPDTDGDGRENAPCVAVGGVPYLTLGLSAPLLNGDGRPFRYGVYLKGLGTLRNDAWLGVRGERYRPSIAQESASGVSLVDKAFVRSNRRLDFCQALRAGQDVTSANTDQNRLHIDAGGVLKAVPYVLADPGIGNMDLDAGGDLFDGLNSSWTSGTPPLPKFEHPNRKRSIIYDDNVVVGYFDQMWERLGCSATMASAGRSLPNVESTMVLLKRSLDDYRVQLDIAVDIAYAENFAAGVGTAGAAAGLAGSVAAMSTDVASAINTAGVTSGASVAAGIAIGLNTAAVALAAANQVLVAQTYADYQALSTRFNTLISTRFNPLFTDVATRVQAGGEHVYSDQ